MAMFRNVGPLTFIGPGATHLWTYTFDGGREVGVTVATPNMREEKLKVELVVVDNGALQFSTGGDDGFRSEYTVRIRNNGASDMAYNLNLGYLE
ncbi:hypothetical protein BH10PSE17_BH10PSE17_37080 [soil metagenome]